MRWNDKQLLLRLPKLRSKKLHSGCRSYSSNIFAIYENSYHPILFSAK